MHPVPSSPGPYSPVVSPGSQYHGAVMWSRLQRLLLLLRCIYSRRLDGKQSFIRPVVTRHPAPPYDGDAVSSLDSCVRIARPTRLNFTLTLFYRRSLSSYNREQPLVLHYNLRY